MSLPDAKLQALLRHWGLGLPAAALTTCAPRSQPRFCVCTVRPGRPAPSRAQGPISRRARADVLLLDPHVYLPPGLHATGLTREAFEEGRLTPVCVEGGARALRAGVVLQRRDRLVIARGVQVG